MPWKEVTMKESKESFIASYKAAKESVSALCIKYGISRKTGYKLIKRYKEEGMEGLKERSRKPASSPSKTPLEVEALICKTRQLHRRWGGAKLRSYLLRKGYKDLPVEKTINRILKRSGLVNLEESAKRKVWKRFEHATPNDLWQMDFKGHFELGEGRCYPLTVLDDHSRYSLLIKACKDQRSVTVKEALIELFRHCGLPIGMTMDNGTPWGYSGKQRHTNLSAWLIRLGIYVSHSRPNHPQTQGKLERFHRTLKHELLHDYKFKDLQEAQAGFDWWKKLYNEERPHAALNYAVPMDRYQRSNRDYPEKLLQWEYDESYVVRKVQQGGVIYLQGQVYRVGEAFYGDYVGLKPSDQDGLMDVYYCHQKVIKIDLHNPVK